MAYTDLITFERLLSANSGAVDALADIQDEAQDVITGVTSHIESYLQRPIIVRPYAQTVRRHHWERLDGLDTVRGHGIAHGGTREYGVYADAQPVIEVNSTGGAVGSVENTRSRFLNGQKKQVEVLYFAGWKRPDQILTDVDEEGAPLPPGIARDALTRQIGLEDLTVDPPIVPAVMQEVCINLCLHALAERDRNLGTRTTRVIGGQNTTVEGVDPTFLSRQLSKLDSYQRTTVMRYG